MRPKDEAAQAAVMSLGEAIKRAFRIADACMDGEKDSYAAMNEVHEILEEAYEQYGAMCHECYGSGQTWDQFDQFTTDCPKCVEEE